MSSDLVFHVVSRRKWPSLNKGGVYQPEDFAETGTVICVDAPGLEEYLNSEYQGRKNLLILVIDSSRLMARPKREKDSSRVTVEAGINLDAILDKIRIDCNPDGLFSVEVDTK